MHKNFFAPFIKNILLENVGRGNNYGMNVEKSFRKANFCNKKVN